MVTEFAEVEYSFFADFEAAPAGFGATFFAMLGFEALIVGFSAFGLAWVERMVRLNFRKLGVMFLCWGF